MVKYPNPSRLTSRSTDAADTSNVIVVKGFVKYEIKQLAIGRFLYKFLVLMSGVRNCNEFTARANSERVRLLPANVMIPRPMFGQSHVNVFLVGSCTTRRVGIHIVSNVSVLHLTSLPHSLALVRSRTSQADLRVTVAREVSVSTHIRAVTREKVPRLHDPRAHAAWRGVPLSCVQRPRVQGGLCDL